MSDKPLFIPLKTEWFRLFESGAKTTEYRAYGPRWNERTCPVGRKATLSHGYSGKRLESEVIGFRKIPYGSAPFAAQDIYPNADFIAGIDLAPVQEPSKGADTGGAVDIVGGDGK